MKELKLSLGSMIRSAREKKGMTRTKLAEFTGISQNTLAKYEKAHELGGKTPGLSKMVKLAYVLEIDPRQIFQQIFDREREADDVLSENFSFIYHFATDTEFLNWQNEFKDVEGLVDLLKNQSQNLDLLEQRLSKLENTRKENGPDQKDPSRSENSKNNTEAVDAASTRPKKGKD